MITLAIAVTALVMACILTVILMGERSRLDRLYEQESQHVMENFYWAKRITFCYDNNIRPCSYDTITTWNKEHPDNTFSVVPPGP